MAISTHVWVSGYETHGFPQVDGGQWDPPGFGASQFSLTPHR